MAQATALADLLQHPPPPPDQHTFDKGRPGYFLDARTRVGSFG